MLKLIFDAFLSVLVLQLLDFVLRDGWCRFFFHLLLLFILREFSLSMFMMLMQIVERMSGLLNTVYFLSPCFSSIFDMHAV